MKQKKVSETLRSNTAAGGEGKLTVLAAAGSDIWLPHSITQGQAV